MLTEHTARPISERERLPRVEVAGYSVRCISSNIRVKDTIAWPTFQISAGFGYEGNIVLGEVKEVGARREMEYLNVDEIVDLPLQQGDLIVGVLANRYSGTSEFGKVPSEGIEIAEGVEIDLIAAGGIIGVCLGTPKTLNDTPTKLVSHGLLAHPDARVADLRDFYPPWEDKLIPSVPVILSCGTAAEIGKTTTAVKLIEGFRNIGLDRVAASKLAGTGRKRDIATLFHAGAYPALDFPDVGLPTTYTDPERYRLAIYTLLNRINREGDPQIIIGECGGDIIEGNIPTLLQDSNVSGSVIAIIHSSTDVLSIVGSLSYYDIWGILGRIPIYLTYPVGRNYQATAYRLRKEGIDLPIFDPLNQRETEAVIKELVSLL